MPRLSLYRPEKGNDYKFIDKTAWEMFQVGGTDVLVHKYIGLDLAAILPPQLLVIQEIVLAIFKICYF
jgi:hypothetical protein